MSEYDKTRALAARLFDAIERGDVDGVADCYAPDLVVWHNFDNLDQSREDNLKTLAGMIERISERRYEQRRVDVFDGGFVQQHVLTGRRKDGVYVSMPGVLVGTLKDGKISRLNEYLDSAHVAAFRAQVGSPA
ncbi:MAG: nuclear transport factor 2 family protein [Pseudomonadota bacterium]|uniref:nuclear transport factor 2 family protein n=1 Tax=unclassified Phenylobacterium TaxID=2640670 RepID=UPI0006F702BC|nr:MULTISPECIES: nuclear transport factor 2 family protein [unclassified Phenylobacterium]KRB41005.1 hypothetical protein ASE02_06455 [Phenylobacterium sp. Root700]MBT9470167.1 nuclear transport factor 2 family protein [Phenylobacterium sp.]